MSVLDSDSNTLVPIIEDPGFDEAQVAAAAFLARNNGRTLDAYRYDLRTFFRWAADAGLSVLEAKRLELSPRPEVPGWGRFPTCVGVIGAHRRMSLRFSPGVAEISRPRGDWNRCRHMP